MSPDGQAVLCLEPRIDGPRHSGGFFYNDCLASAAVVSRGSGPLVQAQPPIQPRFVTQSWDGGPLPPSFILLDSLWWYVHKRPLDVLSEALAGRSWGLVMHGLPAEASGLLEDMAKASFVVVPSFWAAGRLESIRSSTTASGELDVRVIYPGWDGMPGLLPYPLSGKEDNPRQEHPGETWNRAVRIASSSNWIRTKGLLEAASALGRLFSNPGCPSWVWQLAGTPDPLLIAEAHSGLGPLASHLHALGHLEPAALVRLLHSTDIFLHPSDQETFCLSVFEAAMAGCRVVARAIGGVPEAVRLAALLRQEHGLPPAEVHLAASGRPPNPAAGRPAHPVGHPPEETDSLFRALKEAFAAMLEPGASNKGESRRVSPEAGGLLHEFSWQGRLEKLLSGQSDSPLPDTTQPVYVEVE